VKFVNIILSIIILALSCLPCADMEAGSVSHSSIEFASNNESHSHDNQIDLCSPFCTCNCCSGQVLTYFAVAVIDFPVATGVIKIALATYKPFFSSNFYGSIWQPPQIA
jgi:hypothetical protein